jgi:hypothetical protein
VERRPRRCSASANHYLNEHTMKAVRQMTPEEQRRLPGNDDDAMMRMLLDSVPADIVGTGAEAGNEGSEFMDFPDPNSGANDYADPFESDPFAAEASGDFIEGEGGEFKEDSPSAFNAPSATGADELRQPLEARAQSMQDLAADRAGDPVFEATIETFRRNGFPIRPDDETYAVMEFMHLAMRNMEAKFASERRVEMDRLFSMLKDLNDKNEETAVVLRTLMSEQQEAAATLGKRLMWTAKEAATRFANAFSKLHQDANSKMNQSAQAMVGLAEDEFDKELRKLVRDETRIGLAAGIEVEVGGLAKGVKQATATLDKASKVAAARAGKGWLVNLVEDLKILPLGGKLAVAGVVAFLLLALFFRR